MARAEPVLRAKGPAAVDAAAVYDVIAGHFSSTRYKPWPLIPQFLATFSHGNVGADLGCGNGKYLYLRSALATGAPKNQQAILTIGSDRCEPLVRDAQLNFGDQEDRAKENEVTVADALHSGFRTGVFDYALSIATIHHFATPERRMRAVQELVRIVRPVAPCKKEGMGCGAGRFMIFVWAYEQRGGGRRKFDTVLSSDDASAQDVLVPWVMTPQHTTEAQGKNSTSS
ncbi:tRNA (carboxymethyluridine(34)-5-O)-methyltransferase [Malassezia vespertilionis]|uniref:tRNA (carboxymethyluridine(34)-5-O)-methyltransferase n=1 Tax=Malassezia vespertilionis TaxID=2020962 RepID=UPI0024B271F6|nr:tRNA (carboxymethyluridine(34)-5-O)-methyltransferase [Malassezia vespertilionis]WFD05623.1 tRNA (carboxymethyluridine(34)-5-O)-methyltransferase [Malassezia vespertilionis]